jgi:LysR family nitrogen assimilation transcriptional regulator
MDTRHLRSFLKIADTGSISRAAVSLGIAQPSLSQQLLRLEDEVGCELFRRNARGVTLTEAGRVLQEHARQILRATEQAVEDVRLLTAEPSGEVILAVPYSISRLAGVALVEAMRRHAPQVSFRLVEAATGQILGWLEGAKIDLGILLDLGPMQLLSARRLATEELWLIGPADRFGSAAAPAEIAFAEVAGLPLILPGQPHGLRQLLDHEAGRRNTTLKVAQEIDAIGHIGALVAHGHGYSILPLPAVADDLAAGRVSVARIDGGAVRRTLSMVRNAGQVLTHSSVRCEDITFRVLARLIETGAWDAKPSAALARAGQLDVEPASAARKRA